MSRGLLAHVPTLPELERLYWELSRRGGVSVGRRRPWPYRVQSLESLLALAAEMARYDPRTLGVLVQLVVEHEAEIDPRRLRREMEHMRWPQALLVVFEFASLAARDPEVRHMASYLAKGQERLDPPERFFIDAEAPGSRMARRKLGRNLDAYARWGFIGTERPTVDAYRKRTVGRLDAASRRRIARDLVARHGDLSMREYLAAIDHCVSRPQAVDDLHAAGLEPSGRGRGARWTAA